MNERTCDYCDNVFDSPLAKRIHQWNCSSELRDHDELPLDLSTNYGRHRNVSNEFTDQKTFLLV